MSLASLIPPKISPFIQPLNKKLLTDLFFTIFTDFRQDIFKHKISQNFKFHPLIIIENKKFLAFAWAKSEIIKQLTSSRN